MGVDTVFFEPEFFLTVTKNVNSTGSSTLGQKIMKRYHILHKKLKIETPADDWQLDTDEENLEEGDVIVAKVNSRAHRGNASDFVENLIVLLTAANHYGVFASEILLSYSTSWGDSVSGILWINHDQIRLTEVDQSGKIDLYHYSLADYENIQNGTFYNGSRTYEKRIITLHEESESDIESDAKFGSDY